MLLSLIFIREAHKSIKLAEKKLKVRTMKNLMKLSQNQKMMTTMKMMMMMTIKVMTL